MELNNLVKNNKKKIRVGTEKSDERKRGTKKSEEVHLY